MEEQEQKKSVRREGFLYEKPKLEEGLTKSDKPYSFYSMKMAYKDQDTGETKFVSAAAQTKKFGDQVKNFDAGTTVRLSGYSTYVEKDDITFENMNVVEVKEIQPQIEKFSGNVGKELEVIETKDDRKFGVISLAENKEDGQTTWHDVRISEKVLDEVQNEGFKKGDFVQVEGTQKFEQFVDKQDQNRIQSVINTREPIKMLKQKEQGQEEAKTAAPAEAGMGR